MTQNRERGSYVSSRHSQIRGINLALPPKAKQRRRVCISIIE
jgi:hypothetical protein